MSLQPSHIIRRILTVSLILAFILVGAIFLGLSFGPTGGIIQTFETIFQKNIDNAMHYTIIWQIRFPRVLLAMLVGATLSLGGSGFSGPAQKSPGRTVYLGNFRRICHRRNYWNIIGIIPLSGGKLISLYRKFGSPCC